MRRPRKVRRVQRVDHLRPVRPTRGIDSWDPWWRRALEADPVMKAAVQAFVDRMAAKKAAEREAFEARKQARRSHVDPR